MFCHFCSTRALIDCTMLLAQLGCLANKGYGSYDVENTSTRFAGQDFVSAYRQIGEIAHSTRGYIFLFCLYDFFHVL